MLFWCIISFVRCGSVSSIAGFYGFGGSAIYAATKFAVDGMSESLAQEVQPFGIHVTAVKPGYFRTQFLSSGSLKTSTAQHIDDYASLREAQESGIKQADQNQPGDPEKGMEVLIRIAESDNPPLHLFLGKDAYEVARNKIESVERDLAVWQALGTSADFE